MAAVRSLVRVVSAAILLEVAGSAAHAVTPVLWTMESFEDFERGKPDGAAVAAAGELILAPAIRPLRVPPFDAAPEPFLWSQAVDSKGNLYAGGGNGGRIYRVPRGGQGAVYFETGDLAVHALAVDRADVLYAATAPQGKLYRITGEGKGEVYYAPDDRYIWALAVGSGGEIYAATGERGIVYRVPSRGRADIYFDSEEFHVVSLAIDPGGALVAGTDGNGLVYRITGPGKATVLYDSRLREINEIAIDPKGIIYAAAIGIEGEPPVPTLPQPQPPPLAREAAPEGAPVQPPVTLPGLEAGPTATVTVIATAASAAAMPAPPKSEVYRIDPDGTVTVVWSSQDEVVHSLLIDESGRPLIGTGEPGRIRMLSAPRQSTLLARLSESQVTSLARGPARQVFAASSNVGRLYLIDDAGGETGTYVSPTRDAQTVARWGRISWRASIPAGGRVDLSTRSGNSGVPDSTWSEWSPPYGHPEGSLVQSPPARYLQWRARLARSSGAPGPALQAVAVAYVPANLPPALLRVTVNPPGVVRERPAFIPDPDPGDLAFTGIRVGADGPGAPGRSVALPDKKIYVRGMRSLEWEAEDPNGDPLTFDLSFRGDGETAWKPLARGLREAYFAFDSMQLPDGLYRVRVEAEDAGANAPGQGKTATLVSDPFVVDNTPPTIQVVARKTGRDVTLEVTAVDGVGPISRAEYSLDAARWTPVAPADGVPDSRSETFTIGLGSLRPGEHTVIVKVSDLLGNIGAGKATFTSD